MSKGLNHLLKAPFFDVTVHVLSRFVLLIPVLIWDEWVDRYSLDYWFSRREGKQRPD